MANKIAQRWTIGAIAGVAMAVWGGVETWANYIRPNIVLASDLAPIHDNQAWFKVEIIRMRLDQKRQSLRDVRYEIRQHPELAGTELDSRDELEHQIEVLEQQLIEFEKDLARRG